MNWILTAAQARARYFLEHVDEDTLEDDLHQEVLPAWPPVLNRQDAANFLGISMNRVSALSGNGPNGGRLPNQRIRGRVYWRLADLQAYAEERRQTVTRKPRDANGRWLKTADPQST